MRKLFREMQSGEISAREKLVNGNLRLVLSVIQRFNNRGEYVDDLFQVGCIGLMKSIDNFDLGQNVKFSTYAVPMIIGKYADICVIIIRFAYRAHCEILRIKLYK